MALTKRDICNLIAEESGLPVLKVQNIVQRFMDLVVDEVVKTGRIELRNFAVIDVCQRAGRKAHNPRTGEAVMVPPRKEIRFTAGRNWVARVNGGDTPAVEDDEPEHEPVAVAK